MNKKIRVLQLLGGGKAIGGVEKMLLNYYSHLDRNNVQFDFCFYRESSFSLVDEQYKDCLQNSEIYELKCFKKKSSLFGYFKAIFKVKRIIEKNGYDIIHINSGRPALLLTGVMAARRAKAKKIITHSHSTLGDDGSKSPFRKLKDLIHKKISKYLTRHSNYLFACSLDAGEYMFGKKALSSSNFVEVKNAISVSPFAFSPNIRKRIRHIESVPSDGVVYGHVGRFSEEKNHLFLIDVFEHIYRYNPNSILWLIGDGGLKKDVEEKARKRGLAKVIRFFGERKDVNELMQAMDVFLFPSRYEGLSVTLVEAQAASLPIFASDSISNEHLISKDFYFISLKESPETWAKAILSRGKNERTNMIGIIRDSGYDISIEAKKLERIYLEVGLSDEN